MKLTDNELRKLKRIELLELLIEQKKENQQLREKLAEAEDKLKDRQIVISEAGSIAEAALKLNEVFKAADEAAKQYIESVAVTNTNATYEEAAKLLEQTKEKCRIEEEKTRKKCVEMVLETKKQLDETQALIKEVKAFSHSSGKADSE